VEDVGAGLLTLICFHGIGDLDGIRERKGAALIVVSQLPVPAYGARLLQHGVIRIAGLRDEKLEARQHRVPEDARLTLRHCSKRVDEKPTALELRAQWGGYLKADPPDVAVALKVVVQVSCGAAHNGRF